MFESPISSFENIFKSADLVYCTKRSVPYQILMADFINEDELGQTFVVRLVMRLLYKDGYKTHYPSGRTTCASFKTNNGRYSRR